MIPYEQWTFRHWEKDSHPTVEAFVPMFDAAFKKGDATHTTELLQDFMMSCAPLNPNGEELPESFHAESVKFLNKKKHPTDVFKEATIKYINWLFEQVPETKQDVALHKTRAELLDYVGRTKEGVAALESAGDIITKDKDAHALLTELREVLAESLPPAEIAKIPSRPTASPARGQDDQPDFSAMHNHAVDPSIRRRQPKRDPS
jgi:hypothetical protein